MPPFPYFAILKKSLDTVRQNRWLWVFGLFIGSAPGINFWWLQLPFGSRPKPEEKAEVMKAGSAAVSWIADNSGLFSVIVAAALAVFLVLVIISGWARAAVIWSAVALARRLPGEKPKFRSSLKRGTKYLWQIVGLQVLVTLGFFLLLAVIASPIFYLFSVGAAGRAFVLLLFGIAIFFPASIVLGFLHVFGPVFIVAYNLRIGEALQYSFNLVRKKLVEIIIFAAVLAGFTLLFLLALAFSLIIFSIPFALLALLFFKLGLAAAFSAVIIVGLIAAICYTIILGAGFAVFQNVSWVLAVLQWVQTPKLNEDREKVLAPEAA